MPAGRFNAGLACKCVMQVAIFICQRANTLHSFESLSAGVRTFSMRSIAVHRRSNIQHALNHCLSAFEHSACAQSPFIGARTFSMRSTTVCRRLNIQHALNHRSSALVFSMCSTTVRQRSHSICAQPPFVSARTRWSDRSRRRPARARAAREYIHGQYWWSV